MVRCPKCGLEGRIEKYYVNGRAYLRVVHGSGKSKVQCYIGPADNYIHAGELLRLYLTNLQDVDYAALAAELAWRVVMFARTLGLSEPGEWLAKVRGLREELEALLPELEKLEQELDRLDKVRREQEQYG